MSSGNFPIPKNIIYDFISLSENEIIVYMDEEGQYHILANHPVDEDKDYHIYRLSYEDLRDLSS